jgi:hypothetical protein
MNPRWVGGGWSEDQNLIDHYAVSVKNTCDSELQSLDLTDAGHLILLPGGVPVTAQPTVGEVRTVTTNDRYDAIQQLSTMATTKRLCGDGNGKRTHEELDPAHGGVEVHHHRHDILGFGIIQSSE